MTRQDFDVFVETMLTDRKVVEFYYSYRDETNLDSVRQKAEKDFWDHFEESREATPFEIWTIFEQEPATPSGQMVGWAGLLQTELSDRYGGPELQYMVASRAFGKGYATEAAAAVVDEAFARSLTPTIIATVDIPNVGSIRVLEKLDFRNAGRIHSYGNDNMYLYTKQAN